MSVKVTIEGLDKWMRVADPQRFVREVDRAVNQSAQQLRDQAKRMPPVSAKRTGYAALGIPVDTARMKNAIRTQKNDLMDYSDVADVDYSALVHDGTSKMPARPFFRWLLEYFGGLKDVEQNLKAAYQRIISP